MTKTYGIEQNRNNTETMKITSTDKLVKGRENWCTTGILGKKNILIDIVGDRYIA